MHFSRSNTLIRLFFHLVFQRSFTSQEARLVCWGQQSCPHPVCNHHIVLCFCYSLHTNRSWNHLINKLCNETRCVSIKSSLPSSHCTSINWTVRLRCSLLDRWLTRSLHWGKPAFSWGECFSGGHPHQVLCVETIHCFKCWKAHYSASSHAIDFHTRYIVQTSMVGNFALVGRHKLKYKQCFVQTGWRGKFMSI